MHIQTSSQQKISLGFGGYTCNLGVHMCGLYDTDAERDDLVLDYLHQGDVDGDLLRYYHSEPTSDRFRREYARRFPGEAHHPEDPERFAIMSAQQRCYPSGRFEPLGQDPKLKAVRERAIEGRRPIRGLGEMDWAAGDVPGRELLLPYEARLNALFEGTPMVIICTFDLRKFPGSIIMGVLRTHRFAIVRGLVVENPYFDPDGVLAEHGVGWPPLL